MKRFNPRSSLLPNPPHGPHEQGCDGEAPPGDAVHSVSYRAARTESSSLERSELSYLTDRARCILWTADIRLDERCDSGMEWLIRIANMDAAQQILPLDIEPGRAWSNAWHLSRVPEDRQRCDAKTADALRSGQLGYRQEFRCVNRHGDLVWLFEEVTLEAISSGRWKAVGVCVDITQQKQTEDALRLANDRLSQLMTACPLPVAMLDLDDRVHSWNAAAETVFGYRAEELLGQPLPADFTRGDSQDRYQPGETRRWGRDGQPVDVILSAAPCCDATGEATGRFLIFTDIRERKRAEAEWLRSERRFAAMMGHSFSTIGLIDAQGYVLYAPPNTRPLLGRPNEELMGLNGFQFLHPDDQPAVLERLTHLIQHPEESVSATYRVRHVDGSWHWVESLASNLLTDPVVQAIVVNYRDVTEWKEMEETLRESNEALGQALMQLEQTQQQVIQQERLRAVGEMASGIAHDVNNALTPIHGFTELLLLRPEYLKDTERVQRYLSLILTATRDASSTISRLREFYRHRKSGEVFHPVDLNRLVTQSVELTRPKWKDQAQGNGVTIQVDTDLGDLPPVLGNEAALREALANLIFNAVDAIREQGAIVLRTRHDPRKRRVLLEVQDTGVGMTPEARKRCLEPFFTTKEDGGTGLGLSMVYGIVRRHDGIIDIETKLGAGSTFRIALPLPTPGATVTPPPPSEPGKSPPLRVLLVDDEPLVREVIQEFLHSEGHTVELAVDGAQALELYRKDPADLVITDKAMPAMNGEQLALAIKKINPGQPIILMTGFGEFMKAADESSLGADMIVGKPVTMRALLTAIHTVMKAASSATVKEAD